MTTSVTIKHNGPASHQVSVRTFNPSTAAVNETHLLNEGEEVVVTIFDTQAIVISGLDQPKAPDEPETTEGEQPG